MRVKRGNVARKRRKKILKLAKGFEKEQSVLINRTIAGIYADFGNSLNHSFFLETIDELSGFNKYSFLQSYFAYLIRQNNEIVDLGVAQFEKVARYGKPWYLKLSGYQLLSAIKDHHNEKVSLLTKQLAAPTENDLKKEQNQLIQSKQEHLKRVKQIEEMLKELIFEETDQQVLKYLGSG